MKVICSMGVQETLVTHARCQFIVVFVSLKKILPSYLEGKTVTLTRQSFSRLLRLF